MRAKLMYFALQLVAVNGVEALKIDALIAAAEVSRGTFYKYYETTGALTHDIAMEVTLTLISSALPLLEQEEDPAKRIAIGIRTIMRLCKDYPMLGHFLVRLGWPNVNGQELMFEHIQLDVMTGLKHKRWKNISADLAVSVIAGVTIGGIHLHLQNPRNHNIIPTTVAAVLRALGLSHDEAQTLATFHLAMPRINPVGMLTEHLLNDSNQ